MSELRLYAIAIDQVRDIFGADAELAARLRRVSSHAISVDNPQRPSMLSKLGPLFRRPIEPPNIPVNQPLGYDVENLLSGRYIKPERLPYSWTIFQCWLADLACGDVVISANQSDAEQLDFALAAAGLPSDFAVGNLLARDPHILLRPSDGMTVGYSKANHAIATGMALRQTLASLPDGPKRELAEQITEFLELLAQWKAEREQQAAPDLFGIWRREMDGSG